MSSKTAQCKFFPGTGRNPNAEALAEKPKWFVTLSEAKNLSSIQVWPQRDSSAKPAPQNDSKVRTAPKHLFRSP